MDGRKLLALVAVMVVGAFGGGVMHAFDVLGTGTGALFGGDLTDPEDDGVPTAYAPPADLGNFNATFFSSDEPGFEGGEYAFNVFDNVLGGGNDKWCCGTVFPQIVGAELEDSYRLTHFTVSSANDTPERDPRVWLIQGSNDGLCWTTIFSQSDPAAALWTDRLQVLRFDEGIDYEEQTGGYSIFRMVTLQTGLTSGAFFQIGEIEFFGEEAAPAVDPECTCFEPVRDVRCELSPEGDLDLSWENSCECEEETEIRIDEGFGAVTVDAVAAGATSATVPSGELPAGSFSVIVVNCSGLGASCNPFKTDPSGVFQPSAFLAYGPFGPQGTLPCDTTRDEILVNFIAPAVITCFAPVEGDEPGWDGYWDPNLGLPGTYFGPLGDSGGPVVRAYGGQLPDLDTEYGGDDRAQWMITYLEYTGATAIDAEFCIESDDGVVLAIDGQVVHANQICRGVAAQCAGDFVQATIEPGPHVIAASAFDRGGGWQLRMTLRVGGVPVLDGDPDFIFHGRNRPGEADDFPCFEPAPSIQAVTCARNDAGGIDLAWENPEDLDVEIRISLNGILVDEVSPETESYTLDAEEFGGADSAKICVQPVGALAPACCGVLLTGELYINCGGDELVDGEGRVWTQDTLASPSPFLTSPNLHVDAGQTLPDVTLDPDLVDNQFPPEVFQFERWNDGPVEYTIWGLDSAQSYDVHLLFREHCCSDGCLDGAPGAEVCDYVSEDADPPALDPLSVSSTCRIFNILVNDDIVRQTWSKSLWAACLAGTAPGTPSYNIGVSVVVEDLEPVDGRIKILIEDIGSGTNPPENASIKGIAIAPGEPVVEGATFVRGDPDSSGVVNISDGIRILSFLFTGGAALECDDAGDTDDDGQLTITDAIKVFGYLFLGQGDPAAPAPSQPAYVFGDCAVDPTDTDLLGCSTRAAACTSP